MESNSFLISINDPKVVNKSYPMFWDDMKKARDVVARAINTEVKSGRGSEHGGAYLDIATQRS